MGQQGSAEEAAPERVGKDNSNKDARPLRGAVAKPKRTARKKKLAAAKQRIVARRAAPKNKKTLCKSCGEACSGKMVSERALMCYRKYDRARYERMKRQRAAAQSAVSVYSFIDTQGNTCALTAWSDRAELGRNGSRVMHLSRAQVRMLIPHLATFVQGGGQP